MRNNCCVSAVEHFFDSDGIKIRYMEAGKGEPVVLVPGISRSIELSWIEPGIFDWLARKRWVIALDCRGHGKSEKPKGDDAYGRVMVDDVARLLDRLGVQRASLIGFSMGGRITF